MKFSTSFAICFLCLSCMLINAQTIYFQGVYKTSGNNSTIDSVRISNLSTGKDTVLVKPISVDLKTYVSAGNHQPFSDTEFLLNYFGDGAHALKIINENVENVEVELFSYNGVRLASGKAQLAGGAHLIRIANGDLPSGAYFVILNCNRKRALHKLLVQGNSNALAPPSIDFLHSASTGGEALNGGEMYDFIGYLNGFQPVVVKNVIPTEGQLVKFEFDKLLSNYSYTGGFMRIHDMDYTFERNWKVRTPGGKWDRDSIWQADDKLNIYNELNQCSISSSNVSYPKCIDVYNIGDTIKYCCQSESVYKDMQIEKQSDTLLQGSFIIDESNSKFKEIRYYHRTAFLSRQETTGVTEIIITVTFTLENVPFAKLDNGGLKVVLSEEDIVSHYKEFTYYYKNATYNGESTNEITTTLVKPLTTGESGSIAIELTK